MGAALQEGFHKGRAETAPQSLGSAKLLRGPQTPLPMLPSNMSCNSSLLRSRVPCSILCPQQEKKHMDKMLHFAHKDFHTAWRVSE